MYIEKGFVYLFSSITGHYKIGVSKEPEKRVVQFATLPFEIKLVHKIASNDMGWLEDYLHKKYREFRVSGEWFLLPASVVSEIMCVGRMDRPNASEIAREGCAATEFRMSTELRQAILVFLAKERAAGKRLCMNDVIAAGVAHYVGRPELGIVPKETPGRRPEELASA